MMEEIKAKKAELLELVYEQISLKEDELMDAQTKMESLEYEMEQLQTLAERLA